MRRNTRYILKLLLLCVCTIAMTFVTFRMWQNMQNVFDLSMPEKLSAHRLESAHRLGGSSNDKIDYHDYKFIAMEKARIGIGEQGEPAHLSGHNSQEERDLFDANGFNALLSDQISLNRSVKDIRHKDCALLKYAKKLPTVSVVVPFFNEHFSTLLRTAYSVLNRSPADLIAEIILVDDASTKEFLKGRLDHYVAEHLPKVKIVRLPERSGLIIARLAGAKIATGEVLLFLDSHTEPNTNWLPPLLDPIAHNYKVCMCPFIDVVAYDTFEYRAQDEGARGAFDWQFFYKRLPLLPEDLEHPTRPFKSPVMAGGLFAISAKFFWELGGYDEGLDIWGGEQYELSFKIWQCGGEMYDAPCSRIGHIYRGGGIPQPNGRKGDFLHKNYKRVAEVWMDEYKEYLYKREPNRYESIDAGDLVKQMAIRKQLKCKPFKWFMEEVAFDLVEKYPPIEPPDYAYGTIQSVSNPKYCVDSMNHNNGEDVGMYTCAEDHLNPHSNQNFVLSWHKDIRIRHTLKCWDLPTSYENSPVLFFDCHGQQGNQLWKYDVRKKWIMHNDRCLDHDPTTLKLFTNKCDENNPNMMWKFAFVDMTALRKYDTNGPKA